MKQRLSYSLTLTATDDATLPLSATAMVNISVNGT